MSSLLRTKKNTPERKAELTEVTVPENKSMPFTIYSKYGAFA